MLEAQRKQRNASAGHPTEHRRSLALVGQREIILAQAYNHCSRPRAKP